MPQKAAAAFLILLIVFSGCSSSRKTGTNISGTNTLPEKDKMEFDVLFYNATKEKTLGNFAIAANLYEQSLRINPGSPAANYEIANIYNFQGRHDAALGYAQKAAKLDPSNDWYQLLYAECLQNTGKYADAVKVFETLLKNNPSRVDYHYNLANSYLVAGKYKDAIKVYNDLESKIGASEDLFLQKLTVYQQTGNIEKAEEEIKKMCVTFPHESKYYGMLAELYLGSHQPDKAFDALNKMKEIDPNNPQLHLSLSNYYREKGNREESYNELKLAFTNPDLDIDTKVKILLSYYTVTETYPELKGQALELCAILINAHPKEAKAYSIYGDFLYRDEKNAEAREMFRKALEIDKQRYAIWNQLLIIDSELNDNAALEKEGLETIDLFPNQPVPYLLTGLAKVQQKKYNEGIELYIRGLLYVIQNDPLKAQFYANLGDAYHYIKNHDKSDEAYENCLKLDPKNHFVLNNYAYYLSLRKQNLDKAAEMSKRSNELLPNNSSFLDTYAWILFQQQKYDEAKVWMQKALDNGGSSNAVILEHLGDIYYKLNEPDKALEYWKKAKEKGNGSDQVDRKIADKTFYE